MSGESIDREKARQLMMAALDGEIGAGDRAELDRILASDGEMRSEWERLTRLKEVTSAMTYREPPEEVWGAYWASVYNRFERGIGWMLGSIGATILITWGAWNLIPAIIADTQMPWIVKFALLALIAGGAILLVSVLREKLFTGSRDPYKEVER